MFHQSFWHCDIIAFRDISSIQPVARVVKVKIFLDHNRKINATFRERQKEVDDEMVIFLSFHT